MSEYSEDIDDIMHHYDNSNEAEKREMFEDLLLSLYAKNDEEEAENYLWKLGLFWALGAVFVCLIGTQHSALIKSYFSNGPDAVTPPLGIIFLAIVSWSVVVWFCVNEFKGRTLIVILCLLALATLIPSYNSLESSERDRPATNATRNDSDSEEDHRSAIMERKKSENTGNIRPEPPKNLRVEKIPKKWNFDIFNYSWGEVEGADYYKYRFEDGGSEKTSSTEILDAIGEIIYVAACSHSHGCSDNSEFGPPVILQPTE